MKKNESNDNSLVLFYITNDEKVALIAEKYGVDRIWIDLEVIGKEKRQKNMNTVKSHHDINDISKIKSVLTKSDLMVRINPWNKNSIFEIDSVINAGADIIMLPYWKTKKEVLEFLGTVNKRCKTSLLLETKEAVNCIDEVLEMGSFDEIHIGLNDLHLSYNLNFMFELLTNGVVEELCNKFKNKGIPYGFGGIAKLGYGDLSAEYIIEEHYRLGSTRAILSRSFCNVDQIKDIKQVEKIFCEEMKKLREYEKTVSNYSDEEFLENKKRVIDLVDSIVKRKKRV